MPLLRRRLFSSLARALLVASFALAAPGFASALYDRDSAVSSLNAGNWNQMVRQDKDVFWLVEFYAPYCGHCKKLAPEYEAAAKEVRSLYSGAIKAKLGAVDCVENERLCAEYDVRGYPAIKAFPAGAERKKNPEPYDGARDAAGIVAFVREKVAGGGPGGADDALAPRLRYVDAHEFLTRRGPAIPPHGAILVTSGETRVPSWFTSVAVKYKKGKTRQVAFAHVVHEDDPGVARNFKIAPDALPAVVFVRTGGDDAAEGGGGGGGGFRVLASDALGAKAGERIRNAKAFVDEQMKASAEALSPTPRFPPRRRPRKVADVKYAALSEENADAECFGKNKRVPGTCVVAFLPAGSREAHDAVMEATAKKYRNDPFAFFWADAAEQAEMMKASFGLDAAKDSPALVAVKTGKRDRFTARAFDSGEALDVKSASAFLDAILGGDARFRGLDEQPTFEPEYLRGALDVAEEAEEAEEEGEEGEVEGEVGAGLRVVADVDEEEVV